MLKKKIIAITLTTAMLCSLGAAPAVFADSAATSQTAPVTTGSNLTCTDYAAPVSDTTTDTDLSATSGIAATDADLSSTTGAATTGADLSATTGTTATGTGSATAAAGSAVTVDGKAVLTTSDKLLTPYTKNSNLMVPLRKTAEAMGCKVTWNGQLRSVTISNKESVISIYIGSDIYARASAQAIGMTAPESLGAAPEIIHDSTFVPARMFELLDYTVAVSGNTAAFTLNSGNGTSGSDDSTCIANPVIAYDSLSAAEKAAGFTANMPAEYADKAVASIDVIAGDLLHVEYTDGTYFRMAKASILDSGIADISGDYNTYSSVVQEKTATGTATLKGNGEKVSCAIWTYGEYTYAIGFAGGVSQSDALAVINSLNA